MLSAPTTASLTRILRALASLSGPIYEPIARILRALADQGALPEPNTTRISSAPMHCGRILRALAPQAAPPGPNTTRINSAPMDCRRILRALAAQAAVRNRPGVTTLLQRERVERESREWRE